MDIKRRGNLVRDDSNAPAGYNYYFYPSTATSANVALKPGILHNIVLGGPTSGTLTVLDGTATIANITLPATVQTVELDVTFTTSLIITTTGTPGNITVSYISADK